MTEKTANGRGALKDEKLARRYEQQDSELAAWLRVPEEKRTPEHYLAIAARLSYWAHRQMSK
jgi:hypothetical protein